MDRSFAKIIRCRLLWALFMEVSEYLFSTLCWHWLMLHALNTVVDFSLACVSAFELWQYFFKTLHRTPNVLALSQFRKLDKPVRSRRLWQTLILSGLLVLSGVASIVKTIVSRPVHWPMWQWKAEWSTSFWNRWALDLTWNVRTSIFFLCSLGS